MRRFLTASMSAFAIVVIAAPAYAQSNDELYTIMRPEPWLAPKYKSPGTPQGPKTVTPSPSLEPRIAAPPPPIYVPQTGRLLPNMPAVSPAGPGGRETFQDRAARCHHQAGSYGADAGDRTGYIGSCVNQ